MSDTTTPHVPAGWYPDPEGGPRPRWWDGSQWTAQYADPTPASAIPAYAASAPAYTMTGELAAPAGAMTNTVWIWLTILLPLVAVLPLLGVDWGTYATAVAANPNNTTQADLALYTSPPMLAAIVLGLITIPLVILFSYLDWRALASAGVPQPFHWAFAFFYLAISTTAVYVIGRVVVVRRRTGTGLAPLWAQIAAIVVSWIIVGVVVAQVLNAVLTASNLGGLG